MPRRTSITDPLKIDAMPCGNGVVGMTLCPGKHASSAFGTAWARDLALDLDAVVDWGATSLVSLVERHELLAFGVSNLGEAAEEAGLEWHHLPIKDVHIPDERFERQWTYSGHVLRRRLQSGGAHRPALPRRSGTYGDDHRTSCDRTGRDTGNSAAPCPGGPERSGRNARTGSVRPAKAILRAGCRLRGPRTWVPVRRCGGRCIRLWCRVHEAPSDSSALRASRDPAVRSKESRCI